MALAATAGAQSGAISFSASTYWVDADPQEVICANLNPDQDSFLDLLVACSNAGSVSVYFGVGDGTFSVPPLALGRGMDPATLAVADINADALPDILVGDPNSEELNVLYGKGSRQFAAPEQHAAVSGSPIRVRSADAGTWPGEELISLEFAADKLHVVPAFPDLDVGGAASFGVGSGPIDLAARDVDLDGSVDLLVLHQGSNDLWVMHNTDALSGSSFAKTLGFGVGPAPLSMDVADLNQDGLLDVALADGGDNTVRTFRGLTLTTAPAQTVYALPGRTPWAVALADVDLDGRLDCVVTDIGGIPGSVVAMVNDGTGALLPPVELAQVGTWPSSIASADLNGDGRTDLVVANRFSDSVTVLLNSAPLPPGTGAISGRVSMGESGGASSEDIALRNVEIEIDPDPLGASILSKDDGSFIVHGLPAGSYLVRGRATYADPATNALEEILSYAGSVVYVTAGQTTANVDLRYPWPVIAQAGWEYLGASGGTASWNVLTEYFTRDPKAPGGKAAKAIPAFFVFPMPKIEDGFSSQGYDASGLSVEQHSANAQKLADWMEQRVQPELARFVSSNDLGRVRYSFASACMGALIVRALVASGQLPQAQVNRIVSFDGVHGGTLFTWVPGLTEQQLNGAGAPFAQAPGTAPPGWNTNNRNLASGAQDDWLCYTTADMLVSPNLSACGKGRVFELPSCSCAGAGPGCSAIPYCYWVDDYLSGATAQVAGQHLTLAKDLQRLEEAAIFLDRGLAEIEPTLNLGCPQGVVDIEPPLMGAALHFGLDAPPEMQGLEIIQVDSNGSLQFNILLSGEGAAISVLDPTGGAVTKTNLTTASMGDGATLESFEVVQPAVGPHTVVLTSGPAASRAEVTVNFGNTTTLLPTVSPNSPNLGESVQVLARFVAASGATIVPLSGQIQATVSAPDAALVPLVLQLLDDGAHGDGNPGDGVFGGLVPGSWVSLEGHYPVKCQGLIVTPQGPTARVGNAVFTVDPTSGVILGVGGELAVDKNQNGKSEFLLIAVSLGLSSDREMSLLADFKDAAGALITQMSASIPHGLGPGSTSVDLVIPSQDIVKHGVNGPWTLANIRLVDQEAGALTCSTWPDYTTAAYSLASFESLPGPRIESLSASAGHASGGNVLYVHGSGFGGTTSVRFGVNSAQFQVLTPNTLKVTVPALHSTPSGPGTQKPAAAKAKSVDVTVATPWGTYSATKAYTYVLRKAHD